LGVAHKRFIYICLSEILDKNEYLEEKYLIIEEPKDEEEHAKELIEKDKGQPTEAEEQHKDEENHLLQEEAKEDEPEENEMSEEDDL
jgi:hypothetical protein